MKNPLSILTIDPLSVAEKLHAVRNFLLPEILHQIESEPRLVEAMWFLQWVSMPENYAGGLAKFSDDLLVRFADQVGPESLLQFSGSELTLSELQSALEDVRFDVRREFIEGNFEAGNNPDTQTLRDWILKRAKEELRDYLHDACVAPECRFDGSCPFNLYPNRIWHFPRLWKCLFTWMDEHAERVRQACAETSITKEITRWLELAQENGKGVMFIGHSRHGKSVAIRSRASMYPGRVRIVETPSAGSEGELLREIGRALGIQYDKQTERSLDKQRAAIDALLRQARFMLIFDEAQFLFPQTINRRTVPPRLNYVRRAIMDIGISTAFICTHQSWKGVEKNFLKVSGFAMEQFEGRLLRPAIHLVSELTEAEMIEVARVHLPELDNDYLAAVVGIMRSFSGGDHLSAIENIAIISRSYATERGEPSPVLDDLERAINDVLGCYDPAASLPDLAGPSAPAAAPLSSPRKNTPAPARASRSVRPAGFGDPVSRRSGGLAAV